LAAMPATTTGTALTNGFIYARGVQVGNAARFETAYERTSRQEASSLDATRAL